MLGVLAAVVAVLATAAILLTTASASLNGHSSALAAIGMPLGGGTIKSVSVTTGPHSRAVPVTVTGDPQIWPKARLAAGQSVSIDVVIKRPGWVSWLTGSTETLHLNLTTPTAHLQTHYLTLKAGQPITLAFKDPVRVIATGQPGHLRRRMLTSPQANVTLRKPAPAGSIWIAAAPRSWETSKPAVVSWFPAGAAASAVATPAPGVPITPTTPITLTFSKPVSQALGASRPPVSPTRSGTWHTVNEHTIVFRPEGYGYGLGAKVTVGLPGGVRLIGAQQPGVASWSVPSGSTLRLQQLLAGLGYLPLRFAGAHVAHDPLSQVNAAIKPPAGRFKWAYPNVPAQLRAMWAPGTSGVMTKGALMAFENDHGILADGVAGAAVWRSLINATDEGKRSTFGYTYVMVSKNAQSLSLWHSGHSVLTTAVNTGIAQAPTASGTFPVFEHLSVTTMSGTNPDGSHYSDPGIQYVSYFNGGDALHAFTRAQYGFPQSLGCVEMALGPAGQVFPYTPIGTLVSVE